MATNYQHIRVIYNAHQLGGTSYRIKMSITITPSTPIVQTQTITTTVNLITVTSVEFDLAENIVVFQYLETTSDGVINTQTLSLNQADTTTFLATVATAGQTLGNLGISTASATIMTKLGFTGTIGQ